MSTKIPQVETCSNCGGHGIHHGPEGDPVDCRECGGGGLVEARDEKGRFLPWLDAHPPRCKPL